MNRLLSKRAQSLIEYSLILAIAGAALIGMQVYMKRSIQAAIKTSADQLGDQQGAQVLINFKRQTSSLTVSNTSKSGVTRTQVSKDGTQVRDTGTTTATSGSTTSVSQQE